MRTIDVTRDEWEEFLELSRGQMTPRSPYWSRYGGNWLAVFSTNARGNDWSFWGYGNTPPQVRKDLRGIKFVETLKEEYGKHRVKGGRVFINGKGAFYKTSTGEPVPFAIFCFPPALIVRGAQKGYHSPRST